MLVVGVIFITAWASMREPINDGIKKSVNRTSSYTPLPKTLQRLAKMTRPRLPKVTHFFCPAGHKT